MESFSCPEVLKVYILELSLPEKVHHLLYCLLTQKFVWANVYTGLLHQLCPELYLPNNPAKLCVYLVQN